MSHCEYREWWIRFMDDSEGSPKAEVYDHNPPIPHNFIRVREVHPEEKTMKELKSQGIRDLRDRHDRMEFALLGLKKVYADNKALVAMIDEALK